MKKIIFDMDGVITNTAIVHSLAWKQTFEHYFHSQHDRTIHFTHDDYLAYVDGRVRIQGVAHYMRHMGLTIPEGESNDDGWHTMHGLGNQKNKIFLQLIGTQPIQVFDETLALISLLKSQGYTQGIGSSSKNARTIIKRIKAEHYFDFILDGTVAEQNKVKSKPNGEFYQFACQLAKAPPSECVVIEDAISGVTSAKMAGIGLIIAVARETDNAQLYQAGADIVVNNLMDPAVVSALEIDI